MSSLNIVLECIGFGTLASMFLFIAILMPIATADKLAAYEEANENLLERITTCEERIANCEIKNLSH